MKHSFLITILMMVSLVSCSQQMEYSCSPIINSWAIKNLDYFENAPREEIASLPLSKSNALYRGFSKEKQDELWHYKYEYVINNFDLSPEEIDFYQSMINYSYIDAKSYQEFSSTWETVAREQFEWSDERIFYWAYTWMTEEEYLSSIALDGIIKTKVTPSQDEEDLDSCDCKTDYGCIGLGFDCDHTYTDCDATDTGCGLRKLDLCNGICAIY